MLKRILTLLTSFVIIMAFNLPAFAQAYLEGKVEAINKGAKKITIDDSEYILSDEVANIQVRVGDEIQVSLEGDTIKTIEILPKPPKKK